MKLLFWSLSSVSFVYYYYILQNQTSSELNVGGFEGNCKI